MEKSDIIVKIPGFKFFVDDNARNLCGGSRVKGDGVVFDGDISWSQTIENIRLILI